MIDEILREADEAWIAFNHIPIEDTAKTLKDAIRIHTTILDRREGLMMYGLENDISSVYEASLNMEVIIRVLGSDEPEYIELTKDE